MGHKQPFTMRLELEALETRTVPATFLDVAGAITNSLESATQQVVTEYATPDTSSAFASGISGGLRDILVDSSGSLYYLAGNGLIDKISYSSALVLTANQSLSSPNGQYQLIMQSDGNLVEYGPGGQVIWHSMTDGNPGAYATMQSDGNFVVYSAAGTALWNSHTDGNPGAYLQLQNNGNAVIYQANGTALWYGNSMAWSGRVLTAGQVIYAPNGQYDLIMQGDGNLVEYGPGGQAIWNSMTDGNLGAYAAMQSDGNLVVYSAAGTALWNSHTDGNPGAFLVLNNGGALEIVDRGTVIWLAVLGGKGIWSTLTPMPSQRQELSAAVLNGEIYVIAGFDTNGNSTDVVEVYNPQTDTWRSAASLPIATNHNEAAVAAGTLYAFGGTSNRVFAYDPQRNAWNEVAAMHFQHGDTAAVGVIDDKIYVAGGDGPGMQQNEVEVYDPVSNTWTVLPPMHVPRNHTAGGVIDGKFYVVGGRDNPGAPSALERYDPNTGTWTQLAPMPTGRSGLAAAVVDGRLYAFGGEVPELHGDVEVYDPQYDVWEKLEPMPTPRHGIFGAVIDNAIYIIGGGIQQGFGASNVNQVFVVR
jgi:N-acetylneuraminic acid mutarotase